MSIRRPEIKIQTGVTPCQQPPTVRLTDGELLCRIGAGDLKAFDPFVERFERRLVAYLRWRAGPGFNSQVMEDLAQETFLRVFRAARGGSAVNPSSTVAAWLFTIAENILRDHVRTTKRRPVTTETDLPTGTPISASRISREMNPSHAAERREGDVWVNSMLAHLPPEQAEVIALKVIGGLNFDEVAELVKAPLTTVKSRMAYGLRKILTLLNQQRQAQHETE